MIFPIRFLFSLLLVFLLTPGSLTAGVVSRLYYDDLTTKASYLNTPIPDPAGPLITQTRYPDMPFGITLMSIALDDQEGIQPLMSGSSTPAPLPTQYHEFYRSLTRGYLEAPQTGEYIFWVLGDDSAELRLSEDHTRTALAPIAICPGASRTDFQKYESQKSAPILLEKGKKYYFELEHIELVGRDRVAVGWQLPDGTMQRPIPGRHLAPLPLREEATPNADQQDVFPRYTVAEGVAPRIIAPEYFRWPLQGQPTNAIVRYGETAYFITSYEATQPVTCQWRRDGKPIPGANLSWIAIPNVGPKDHGAAFDLVITNPHGTVTTAVAYLYVDQADLPQLTVVSAATRGNLKAVDVSFSRPVDAASAAQTANYTLGRLENNTLATLTVTKAEAIGNNTVRLFAELPEGYVYRVTVTGVTDTTGTPMVPGSVQFLQVQGVAERQFFLAIGGDGTVQSLLDADKFKQGKADILDFPSSLGTPLNPLGGQNYYGSQWRGFITAPVTGPYVFAIAANDQAAFYLSTDAQPQNKTRVAFEAADRGYRSYVPVEPAADTDNPANNTQYVQPDKVSVPQLLEGGKKYYFEILHKDGAGDDHVNVAWQKPGDAPIVEGAEPIGPEYLSSFNQASAPLSIQTQPKNVNVNEAEPAVFQIGLAGTPRYNYQWYRNGNPLEGATSAVYRIAVTSRKDHDARFHVEASNGFSSVKSQEAVLSITFDGIPPQLLSVTGSPSGDRIVAHFSELLAVTTVNDPANYSLNKGALIQRAEVSTDGSNVVLFTTALAGGENYSLSVSTNITDNSPGRNPVAENTKSDFQAWKFSSGFLQASFYKNIPGKEIGALRENLKFQAGTPDELRPVSSFASTGYGENYGVEIVGFIIPPSNGDYRFTLRSSGGAQLFVSSDDKPENIPFFQPDIETPGSVTFTESTSSRDFTLVADSRYFVMALFKTGTGNDFFEVAFRSSSDPSPLTDSVPVSGNLIAVYQPLAVSGAPTLSIRREAGNVVVTWPVEALGFDLQSTTGLTNPVWFTIPDSRNRNSVTLPAGGANGFFRLRK